MNAAHLKAKASAWLDENRAPFLAVARAIHAHPELAFHEFKAQEVLTNLLESEGFKVKRSIADLPTSWRASYGVQGPKIAFLSEYDALPQIGHACGHNLIGTGGVAAAIALKATCRVRCNCQVALTHSPRTGADTEYPVPPEWLGLAGVPIRM